MGAAWVNSSFREGELWESRCQASIHLASGEHPSPFLENFTPGEAAWHLGGICSIAHELGEWERLHPRAGHTHPFY